MTLRDWVHVAGRVLTRALLDPESSLKLLGDLGMAIFEITELGVCRLCRVSKVTHAE
jgi:hypothetical protein